MSNFLVREAALNPMLAFLGRAFQECPDPRFLYIPDSSESIISIQGMDAFNLEVVGGKPGITVELDSIHWRNAAIGKLLSTTPDGGKTLVDILDGTLICHCYSRTSKVSADLASLVFCVVRTSRDEICSLGYREIDSREIGKTSRYRGKDASGESEFRSTPVIITFSQTWTHHIPAKA